MGKKRAKDFRKMESKAHLMLLRAKGIQNNPSNATDLDALCQAKDALKRI